MQYQVHSQPVGSQRQATGRPVSTSFRAGGLVRFREVEDETLEDSEEIWQLHSLPDVLLLNPEPRKGGGDSVFGLTLMRVGILGCSRRASLLEDLLYFLDAFLAAEDDCQVAARL